MGTVERPSHAYDSDRRRLAHLSKFRELHPLHLLRMDREAVGVSPELITGILTGTMLVALFAGANVAFALGGVAMALGLLIWGPQATLLIIPAIESIVSNF